RPAGGGEVDDAVDETYLRRQLDGAVQLDDLHRLAARLEPGGRGPRVLGCDPDQRGPRLGPVKARGIRYGQHEPARAAAQVDQLVVRAGRLPQDVLADDAEAGRPVVDVGGHGSRPA